METRFGLFNINLSVAALALALAVGCETTGGEKGQKEAKAGKGEEGTVIRLHLEVNPDESGRNHAVPVFRAQPMMVNINNEWFLNEGDVEEAAVVDAPGGFAIMLRFSKHGTLLLETASTSFRGSRVAIFSQFGPPPDGQRWIAAPRLGQRITNGILTFTPDATREEAQRIVLGLNNIAQELKKRQKWW
jgi:hypothetical protein